MYIDIDIDIGSIREPLIIPPGYEEGDQKGLIPSRSGSRLHGSGSPTVYPLSIY